MEIDRVRVSQLPSRYGIARSALYTHLKDLLEDGLWKFVHKDGTPYQTASCSKRLTPPLPALFIEWRAPLEYQREF